MKALRSILNNRHSLPARPLLGALLAMVMLNNGAPVHAEAKPGRYDGSQMEMAVALDLRADGRFEYWLSYGALDESATGRWRADGENVVLMGDPVVAPHFTLMSSKPAKGSVFVTLEAPKSLPISLFMVALKPTQGDFLFDRLTDEGANFPIDSANPPVSLQIALPMFEIVGEEIALEAGAGRALRFRFEPNDLGKADFRDTILEGRDGALVLERHGREIRFRPAAD